ncbi:YigZ family protein [Capnocytophaga sp. oral taxon 878]|uniref:IMPACT family protein n=1 Tax=Capnocytophaga sp. oral taxon 878 TaxID=1316596 RepID=UPI000D045A2A|nr:YigZ family protein [Capnocytophaga sp. oral taxon 878]AVM50340.1 YigZ family protein [Capnocytophaga sp. oral taxon 878]
MDTYKTIAASVEEVIFKEKSSKFLGYAFHVTSEEEIKANLEAVKRAHFSARHWCYAWQLGYGSQQRYRANDDGEPNNTAGIPIHGQILSFGLTNVLVIVVRYFGGIKLGVGGLVQAYKTTAQLTLQEVEIVEKLITEELIIRFEYPLMNKVMRVVKEQSLTVSRQELTENCTLYLSIRQSDYLKAKEIFENIFGVVVVNNESSES